MDSIFIIFRDIWPEFYPKVILEVIAKVLFPALVDLENIMMFFDEKVFSLKMSKFQIFCVFQSDVYSHEKFLFRLKFLIFFIWIWGNAVRIGLSNAVDWNFDRKIEFHLEKNNRNAITQSMDFL